MKTLLIIRHAKAEAGYGLRDFDRALSDRGRNDALMMAGKISDKKISIDIFISSPAKRTTQTAQLFCKTLHKSEDGIIFINDLYHAPSGTFYEAVENIDDRFSVTAIFGHNPGVTDFVNSLVKEVNIDNMPTCGIFAITANIKSWKKFSAAEKAFYF
ncbi:MAG: histidine phosphatase family protein [Chitinophagaceae bacterium]|nr:histidine phosphatase family protein [Chitinophagaceae bacterium]